MAKKSITEVVSLIVSALEPFTSDERHRAVSASLTLLGEGAFQAGKSATENSKSGEDTSQLPTRAQSWMKQNKLSIDQLQQIFHWADDGVEVIAGSVPGKNNREKVRSAYVLWGVASLLSIGVANFDDKSARAVCEKLGIYDQTNHMKYMKGGNEFTGSKDKGWTLTSPGLKHGADLVASLSQ
jgi:hypothetical protein